jgi:hypothetical protein
VYTIAIRHSDHTERYIGHRGTLGDAQTLAREWSEAAAEYQITHVFINREGDRLETMCTGFQPR